jgi:hypothetical protein
MKSCDNCAICREKLDKNIYTVPECSHKFHTNCIMTWFRTGHNNCPLCQNTGINSLNDMDAMIDWCGIRLAFQNYKTIRAMSRGKNTTPEIKKKIKKLIKLEKKYKNLKKEINDFDNSCHPNMTTKQIIKKHRSYRGKKWKLDKTIERHKQLIGFSSKITNIIIPIKKIV